MARYSVPLGPLLVGYRSQPSRIATRPFAFSFHNTHKTHRRPFRPSQSLTVR